MKSDSEIERDVRDELTWNPDLDASDIAVSVKDGVVTLAGFTHSYADRLEAEFAAKRVAGVRAIANDIEVRLPSIDQRPDPDIARDAVSALKSELPISNDKIKATVRDGTSDRNLIWFSFQLAMQLGSRGSRRCDRRPCSRRAPTRRRAQLPRVRSRSAPFL